jgi:hypothetical protein
MVFLYIYNELWKVRYFIRSTMNSISSRAIIPHWLTMRDLFSKYTS